MIQHLPHSISEGLRQENEAHARGVTDEVLEHLPARLPALGEFVVARLIQPEGLQVQKMIRALTPPSRILDVGAGDGWAAVCLASQGHTVVAVEPSLNLCRYIERLAAVYRLPIDIYQVSGEALGRLPLSDLDACLFNQSLHHCDDPVASLTNCRELLRPGGRMFLLNEPLLHRFRTKAGYYRLLQERPEEMGHYGGNEHIYHHHEYVRMLKRAGFGAVQSHLSLRYLEPQYYFPRQRGPRAGAVRQRARRAYYRAVRGLWRAGAMGRPVLAVLKQLSLLETYFTASKLPAAG